ncbi:SAM-dependent methyltransferase [Streptomyces sp. NBC_01387]|uniref:SAM-dependent methyltransferase n=1 Tax=unclassified Streptomyces TaxID=2593676 RepID=UPI002024D4FA|nr:MULTISPECIES: SAM-dependent methyltransferase [unclassified Streptomyces]MCX4551044.1 SAM-dependent methyltransferase [Streptomyces sp. NBC_01500]WSC22455.1 SAM-dependent methyltransferase [Streptomyces sp. NBC_01766]WSV56298.1 SAM-dependent methyltransferase [Streptomyces sp. NBC_01014]
MSTESSRPQQSRSTAPIDTSKPHPARVYDYLLGGKDNYPVDQALAERLTVEAQEGARENRAFMHRAADWVARSGIDQFLDIGTGIPTEPNLHQIVQGINPLARVVYTDNDPIVLRHAEALLVSTVQGATDYIEADVREPTRILEHARKLLDFNRPVCVSLIALMHFVPDEDDPYGITRTLVDALAPGSCLVLSHLTADFLPEERNKVGEYRASGINLRPRSRAEVEPFFEGLDLVEPGLVTRWYKDTPAPVSTGIELGYSGIAYVR